MKILNVHKYLVFSILVHLSIPIKNIWFNLWIQFHHFWRIFIQRPIYKKNSEARKVKKNCNNQHNFIQRASYRSEKFFSLTASGIIQLSQKKIRKIKTTPDEFRRIKPKWYRIELVIWMIYFQVQGAKKRKYENVLVANALFFILSLLKREDIRVLESITDFKIITGEEWIFKIKLLRFEKFFFILLLACLRCKELNLNSKCLELVYEKSVQETITKFRVHTILIMGV